MKMDNGPIAEPPSTSAKVKVEESTQPSIEKASPAKRRASTSEDIASDDEPPTKKRRQKEAHETPTPKAQESKTGQTKVDPKSKDGAKAGATDAVTTTDSKGKTKQAPQKVVEAEIDAQESTADENGSEVEEEESEEEKPEEAKKARAKIQSTLKSNTKDPYPDWQPGESVPYAALCTTFSLIENTTKRLEIMAHCTLFLRQVLRLTPQDMQPTVMLMLGKLAADYAGIELGIGESLIMKAISETTGRSLAVIKADQQEIGDLGLVAAKSRSNQTMMMKPKPLTVRGVHNGLLTIATIEGQGSQGRKVGDIRKLLSSADGHLAGKKNAVDITKDKGGPSESKYIVRTLEGKMRLGLADKTVLVALAHAMVWHDTTKKGDKVPSQDTILKGENVLKGVYK